MDRLIEDYERALTEELERHTTLDYLEERIATIESKEMYIITTADYKLPQWKAQEYMAANLSVDESYKTLKKGMVDAALAHGKAKIRLAVAVERLKLTRARLYGGHHDLLDVQEVGPSRDEDLG